jgi:hypothetical protein
MMDGHADGGQVGFQPAGMGSIPIPSTKKKKKKVLDKAKKLCKMLIKNK